MLNPTQPLFFLLVYLAVLYVRPHEYVPALMGVPLLPISLIMALVLWLGRQAKDFSAPQFKLIPVLTVLMAWSVLMSGWLTGAIGVFTEFYPVVLLFFMLATTVDSIAKLKQVFMVLSVSMAIIAAHCIDQAQTEDGIGWTGAKMIDERVAYLGFLSDPNDLSMAFVMILPMVFYLAKHSGWIFKLAWGGVAMVILNALMLANSRGAILSVASMLLQFGILRFGLARSLVVGPLLLLPIVVFGPSRMNEISADEESAEGRIDAWHEGFQMLIHHPIFGVGKGLFTEYNRLTAHNSYVLAMAELGLVGYFVWLSNVVLTWMMVARVQATPAPVVVPPGEQALDPLKPKVYGKLPAPKPHPNEGASWEDIQDVSRTLWYGLTGALVSIFFLSRSYVPILYTHIALIVAVYHLASLKHPGLAPIQFADRWGRLLVYALGSTIGLWVATAILLRI